VIIAGPGTSVASAFRPPREIAPPVFILDSFEPVPAAWRGAFLAVGNFDGVHRGHARLIGRLRDRAHAAGAPALALTFDPHPISVLRPHAAPVPLTWTTRTAALLQQAGADEVGVFQTGPWLLGLTAREFFERVILGQFAARGMVEGPTFGFGRDRGGDANLLAGWCEAAGLAFEVAPPTEIDGRIVSSSRIRAALAAGDTIEAATLLGRPHRLRGEVRPGANRGAGLGFATANLHGIDTQIPESGVYAALAWLDDDPSSRPGRPTAVHIGPNATFGEQTHTVEAHLIDFPFQPLYGRQIQLDLLDRLRGTQRFADVSALRDQIREDVARARNACNAWNV
jgi:riboflavin kinase/FMN adenylyltransferase